MAFREVPALPRQLSFGALGGPRFVTEIVTCSSGDEQRNQAWSVPLWQYQFGLAPRSAVLTQELVAFFRAIAQGRTHGFRFHDFGAGEAVGEDEPIGTGTGAPATYQLIKRYELGDYTFDRTITKPVAGTLVVKSNGTIVVPTSINTTLGTFVLNTTLGNAVTASYEFDVPVRFDSDAIDLRKLDGNAFDWSNVSLTETRDVV
jgi:uncharacterized protein (TIGR02217 family)